MGLKMNRNIISETIIRLYETERFYAEIISQMRRIVSERIPTAGVCVRDHIELHINPKFFAKLTIEERVAVFKHECEHILRSHIERSKEAHPEVYSNEGKSDTVENNVVNQMKHQVINVAADCAINYGLQNLPEGGVYPKTFKLPDGQTMEWYLANLKDNEELQKMMPVSGHELWGESDGNKDTLKEKIRQAVNRAAQTTRGAGQLSAEHELLVANLNKDTAINWRAQLKRFVARSIETTLDTSKKKRNRRYGVMYPGIVKEEQLHIGVAVDTSGSISDQALKQFMVEIGHIAKYAKVTVVEADSEVKKSYEYNPKKEYKVSGRGGTAYQPAFDFFNKQKDKIDGMIYLGDMDVFDSEAIKKPKYPVLWATVGRQKPPANFGTQIFVEVKQS